MSDKMRGAFEFWCKSEYLNMHKDRKLKRDHSGQYEDVSMQFAWRAYRAALSQQPEVSIDPITKDALEDYGKIQDFVIVNTGRVVQPDDKSHADVVIGWIKELSQKRAREGWKSIESAPADGTRILLRGKNGRIADGHYGQPNGWANPKQFIWPYIHADPIEWLPLDSLPDTEPPEQDQ